eukprot:1015579-Alexandrium_andersonii.AAC.1
MCNPESAKCSSVLQSSSIRSPPGRACKIASRVRTLKCAGSGLASKSVPEASEGCNRQLAGSKSAIRQSAIRATLRH